MYKNNSEEDQDIKIAGDSFESAANDDSEGDQTARELQREKDNGNLNRARRLGAIMADDVSAIEGDSPSGDSVLMTQRRILLAFAVAVGLESFLSSSLLSETAQSVFYDTLGETAPSFYEDLQESNAFSFYYLCVRDSGQVETKVGKTFASLCGMTDNETYARMGEELYRRFIGQVQHYTEVLAFVPSERSTGV